MAPALYQFVSQSSNPVDLGAGDYGPNFTQQLPNPSGAGNTIIIAMMYPNGRAPTITDNLDTWSSTPVVSADNGAGNYVAAIFVLLNCSAGKRTINFQFGTDIDIVPCTWDIFEVSGIATASALNGTHSTTGQTGSSLTVGSFTPTTNNDANGGNLIFAWFALAAKAADNTQVSDWTAGGSFTLLEGNTAFQAFRGVQTDPVPTASMFWVQTTQAAVNPGITAGGQTTTQYNNLAIALKASPGAGTPKPTSGIWVNKVIWFSGWQAVTAMKMKIPCVGNFRVLVAANQSTVIPFSGCTDNAGGTWTYSTSGSVSAPQLFYIAGPAGNTDSPNGTLLATVACSDIDAPTSFAFYDLSGVDTSNPIGATQFNGVTSVPGNAPSTPTNAPNITPTKVGSWVLAVGPCSKGPATALVSPTPAAAIMDNVVYDNQSDVSMMDNSDLYAHYITTSLTAINWTWNLDPNPPIGSADIEPGAWEFLPAAASPPTSNTSAAAARYLGWYRA